MRGAEVVGRCAGGWLHVLLVFVPAACRPEIPQLSDLVPLPRDASDEFFFAPSPPLARDAGTLDSLSDDAAPSEIPLFAPHGCAMPPQGVDGNAYLAYDRVNSVRVAAGLPCVTVEASLALAARQHCEYFAANRNNPACIANPHRQVAGCPRFVGEHFVNRVESTGYRGEAAFEVMAPIGDGARAVELWLDSIWHRIPFFAVEVGSMGYGSAAGCDTMVFGRTPNPVTRALVTYPVDRQTNVPLAFHGNEHPPPPPPPSGWPSGYPISLHAPGVSIESHVIMADDNDTPLPHTFLAPGEPRTHGLLVDEYYLYTHAPLLRRTRYRVRLTGRRGGAPFEHTLSFTTR